MSDEVFDPPLWVKRKILRDYAPLTSFPLAAATNSWPCVPSDCRSWRRSGSRSVCCFGEG